MSKNIYIVIAACAFLLSSCYKQSIADAMLTASGRKSVTATLNYQINGTPVSVSVMNADNQAATGFHALECVKQGGYVFSGVISLGVELVYIFNTDSLKVGNYKTTGIYSDNYVTTFQGRPQYLYGPSDFMSFTVTSYKNGHISGNFSGQLTPAIAQNYPNNIYGAMGSVVIKNGSFTNVPVIY